MAERAIFELAFCFSEKQCKEFVKQEKPFQ